MFHRGVIALLLGMVAIALGACGGDDESGSKTSAARGTTGEQDATRPKTGATGATRAERARPKRAAKSKQRQDERSAAPKGKTGSGAATTPATGENESQPYRLTKDQLKQLEPNQYAQARELCRAQTLEALSQYYGIESRDPDEVAERYAKDYIPGLREAAARGCKAGLLESK